eukprot:gene14159-11810_t
MLAIAVLVQNPLVTFNPPRDFSAESLPQGDDGVWGETGDDEDKGGEYLDTVGADGTLAASASAGRAEADGAPPAAGGVSGSKATACISAKI